MVKKVIGKKKHEYKKSKHKNLTYEFQYKRINGKKD